MTFRSVTNDELLEEIKTLQSTVNRLTRQLDQLNLRQRQGQQEESISTDELQVGQTVELLTKAKHGKSGDKATVLHIGKTRDSKAHNNGRNYYKTTQEPEDSKGVRQTRRPEGFYI